MTDQNIAGEETPQLFPPFNREATVINNKFELYVTTVLADIEETVKNIYLLLLEKEVRRKAKTLAIEREEARIRARRNKPQPKEMRSKQ